MLKYVNTKFHDHPAYISMESRMDLWDGGLIRPCSASGKMKAKQPISVCEDGPVFETGTIVMWEDL